MLERLNRQEVIGIIVFGLVCCGIIAGFYFLFWQPKAAVIEEKQQTLNLKRMQFKQLKQDIEDWPETFTREQLIEKRAFLERLLNAVPREEEIPDILDKVQQYAINNAGLTFLSLIKDEAATENSNTTESKYKHTVYRLSVNGDFFGILDFLRQLETSQRLIIVDEMRLQNAKVQKVSAEPSERNKVDTVKAMMTFRVFYSGAAKNPKAR